MIARITASPSGSLFYGLRETTGSTISKQSMRSGDQNFTCANPLLDEPTTVDLRAKLENALFSHWDITWRPLEDMGHRLAVLPCELASPNDDSSFDRADMKHSAGELPGRERHALLLTSVS
jgi:hypothetical protein